MGLAIDLFWVWPLGLITLGFSLFILIIYLYSQKYSYFNQAFLFALLAFSSLLMLIFFSRFPGSLELLVFSFLFFWLSVKLRQIRTQSLRNI